MSDGIELISPCCPDSRCINREYDELKINLTDDDFNIYDSKIPVFTCLTCGKKWAIESAVNVPKINTNGRNR